MNNPRALVILFLGISLVIVTIGIVVKELITPAVVYVPAADPIALVLVGALLGIGLGALAVWRAVVAQAERVQEPPVTPPAQLPPTTYVTNNYIVMPNARPGDARQAVRVLLAQSSKPGAE